MQNLGQIVPRECERASLCSSFRGAANGSRARPMTGSAAIYGAQLRT
jgi:hypothetical protein